jgi:hypothetical protein
MKITRIASCCAALLALLPWGARAGQGEVVKFNDIFHDCQKVGEVRFGAGERWASCRVLHFGFVATIGIDDMYYTEYCLQDARKQCGAKAMVVYRNRAKHPDAVAEIVSVDPRNTRYETPMMFGEDGADMMVLGSRKPGARGAQRRYLQYRAGAWQAMDTRSWQGDLVQYLPAGTTARLNAGASAPDPQTLSLRAPLFHAGSQAGSAEILLKVADGRLAISNVTWREAGNESRR